MAHIDLAPTIVDIAGGTVPSFVDGKSFKRLIDDPNSVPERNWREPVLIENWETKALLGNNVLCASNTMRNYDTVYTEHATGDFEYYDLSQDPLQLDNSYNSLSTAERSSLALKLRSLKADGEIQVGIISPKVSSESFSGAVEISGIVDAPAGATDIRIAVQDATSGKFWNGNNWSASFQQISANLGSTSGLLSTWSYDFDPTADQRPVGTVKTWAWGHDLAGRFSTPAAATFELEPSAPPVSKIISPVKSATKPNKFEISGTASSSSRKADRVRLVIRRKDDGKYLNGSKFQSNWTFTPVPVKPDGTWSTPIKLDAGAYFAVTYAIDESGVREQTPQVHLFFVE